MIDTPYGSLLRWAWARAHQFIQNPPYFVRESSRAHLRLLLIELGVVFTIVLCVLGDSRPGDILDKLFFVWNGRGYLIVAALSLFAALMAGTEFFRSLYGIASFRAALDHYLVTSMFGIGFVNGLKGMVRALIYAPYHFLLAPLFGFYGYKYFVVEHGEIHGKDRDSPIVKAGGPCFLVVIKDTALVLEQDGLFTRVVKPGFAFLEPFETIREAVDLRPQIRANIVRALTKDGIPIQVNMEIEFMIQSDREVAVRRAAYNQTVFRHGTSEETLDWKDLVMFRAEFELQRTLNTFVLDRLVGPDDANPRVPLDLQETPRREIQVRLLQALNTGGDLRQLGAIDLGVIVTRVTLENLQIAREFADSIKETRIESWRAEWRKRATISRAEAEVESMQWKETARAKVQAEMLNMITGGLEELDTANRANLPHLLGLRVIEAIEQMSLDPLTQAFIPEETLAMLHRLRRLYV